jgi:hypothetical protein
VCRYDKTSALLQVPLYCILKALLDPGPVQLTAHEREYAELICSHIMTLGEMHHKFDMTVPDAAWENAKRRFNPANDGSRASAGLADVRRTLIDGGELSQFYVPEDPTYKGKSTLTLTLPAAPFTDTLALF